MTNDGRTPRAQKHMHSGRQSRNKYKYCRTKPHVGDIVHDEHWQSVKCTRAQCGFRVPELERVWIPFCCSNTTSTLNKACDRATINTTTTKQEHSSRDTERQGLNKLFTVPRFYSRLFFTWPSFCDPRRMFRSSREHTRC